MKLLITGIAGFAARHFVEMLATSGEEHSVAGVYFNTKPEFTETEFLNIKCKFFQANLIDATATEKIITEVQPDFILHLASISSVSQSWKKPGNSVHDNTGMFLNIIEVMRKNNLACRLLSVGSTEEYGIVKKHQGKLKEEVCPHPASPYGAARVLQQMLSGIYAKNYDLDIIHTRSFNHIGSYQNEEFVISSFAKQIAEQLKAGSKKITLRVGDVNVIRDFTNVRDVVKAYYLLMLHGKKGETYNVCSGKGYRISALIKMFGEVAGIPVDYEIDQEKFRPSENKEIVGSYKKLKKETGWIPEITLKESLREMLGWWSKNI